MTDLRTAAQAALKVFEEHSAPATTEDVEPWATAIYALRAALAEPVQEPVGVVTSMVKGGVTWSRWPSDLPDGTKLYTAPPKSPAEPLQNPMAWRYSTLGVWVYVDNDPNLWQDKPDGEIQALYLQQTTVCLSEEKNDAMLSEDSTTK